MKPPFLWCRGVFVWCRGVHPPAATAPLSNNCPHACPPARRVEVCLERAFEPGMAYVALRCLRTGGDPCLPLAAPSLGSEYHSCFVFPLLALGRTSAAHQQYSALTAWTPCAAVHLPLPCALLQPRQVAGGAAHPGMHRAAGPAGRWVARQGPGLLHRLGAGLPWPAVRVLAGASMRAWQAVSASFSRACRCANALRPPPPPPLPLQTPRLYSSTPSCGSGSCRRWASTPRSSKPSTEPP